MKDYTGSTLSDKRRIALGALREPPVSCPHCEARVTVPQLLSHVRERCLGYRTPHHLAKWIDGHLAASHGISRSTLIRLRKIGKIRSKMEWSSHLGIHVRLYLERDVVRAIAARIRPPIDRPSDGP